MARSGATVGKAFIYKPSWGVACFVGYLIRCRCNTVLMQPDFLFAYTQTEPYWWQVREGTVQATIQHCRAEKYGDLVVTVPPLKEQKAIIAYIAAETAKLDAPRCLDRCCGDRSALTGGRRMILESLTVEQYHGFASRTSIEFDPRFTLIVGENGVGKTSVLWALRVLLSHTLAKLVKKPAKHLLFQQEDITRGWPYLRAEVAVGLDPEGKTATCVSQKNAAGFVPSTDEDGRPREHAVDTPDKYEVGVVRACRRPTPRDCRTARTRRDRGPTRQRKRCLCRRFGQAVGRGSLLL
ncbi:MAG: AAA family ATPase [Candidatus Omnitrophica bacterium]|nr:AAA family ATPase [Candidatus Omnitrophota bacterium]